jgi:hypothetical protein
MAFLIEFSQSLIIPGRPECQEIEENHVIVNLDTMMDVLGQMTPVTIVRQHNYTDCAKPAFRGQYRYFAKDIALIKSAKINYPDSTVHTVSLTEYYINN